MNTPELRTVELTAIVPSKTNPRRTFDQHALDELTQSIKDHGLLQPILLRPLDNEKPWKRFEVVCGERRYRASKLAGLNEIMANIRELTDDHAFELQIIENLERRDIHPLHEAEAFQSMLDTGRYQIADVAAKLAKTEVFIVQRLKLNSLIDSIKIEFLEGLLTIGQAIIIARCTQDIQLKIYKNSRLYGEVKYGTIAQLKNEMENNTRDLTKAMFDITNEKLISACGACTACPKRSGATPQLFEDLAGQDHCFDTVCYSLKVDVHMANKVSDIIRKGRDIYFITGYGDQPGKKLSKILEENGKKVLNGNQYNTHCYSSSDPTPRKAMYVGGSSLGKVVDIFFDKSSAAAAVVPKGKTQEEMNIQFEIAAINQRQKRATELDYEKIQLAIQKVDRTKIHANKGPLSDAEKMALYCSIYDKIGYYNQGDIEKFGFVPTPELVRSETVTDFMLNAMIRVFITAVLPVKESNVSITRYQAAAYRGVLEQYFPENVKSVVDSHTEAALVRTAKAEARIAELEAQLARLKAEAAGKKKSNPKLNTNEIISN